MYTWTCINLNIVEYKFISSSSQSFKSSSSINLNIVEYKSFCNNDINRTTVCINLNIVEYKFDYEKRKESVNEY